MKVQKNVTKIEIGHEDLVNLFSTAMYGDSTFSAWVDDDNKHLKESGCGNSYEDKLANVLLSGGYICISDNEAEEDECNSIVLKVAGNETFDTFMGECKSPYYKIDLTRIKTAFREILEDKTTGEFCDGLKDNFNELFIDEEGDFYTAWNLLQYIIFGDVIYG